MDLAWKRWKLTKRRSAITVVETSLPTRATSNNIDGPSRSNRSTSIDVDRGRLLCRSVVSSEKLIHRYVDGWAHTHIYSRYVYRTGVVALHDWTAQSRPTISRHYDRIMIVIRGAQKAPDSDSQPTRPDRIARSANGVENRSITLRPRCNYDHLKRYNLISFPDRPVVKRLRGARSSAIIETVRSLARSRIIYI